MTAISQFDPASGPYLLSRSVVDHAPFALLDPPRRSVSAWECGGPGRGADLRADLAVPRPAVPNRRGTNPQGRRRTPYPAPAGPGGGSKGAARLGGERGRGGGGKGWGASSRRVRRRGTRQGGSVTARPCPGTSGVGYRPVIGGQSPALADSVCVAEGPEFSHPQRPPVPDGPPPRVP